MDVLPTVGSISPGVVVGKFHQDRLACVCFERSIGPFGSDRKLIAVRMGIPDSPRPRDVVEVLELAANVLQKLIAREPMLAMRTRKVGRNVFGDPIKVLGSEC